MNSGHLVEEALVYIEEIRKCFPHRSEVCQDFLVLVRNFKAQTLSKEDLQKNIDCLFEHNRDLSDGFTKFFTAECADFSDPLKPCPFHQAHAMQYVINVRNRFLSDPEVYSAFLKLLTTFNKGVASHNSVLSEVAALFRGHADLLMEFTCFIPITEQQQARDYMQRIIAQSATTAAGAETACVTPTQARTTASDGIAGTDELGTEVWVQEDENLILDPDPRMTTRQRGRGGSGGGRGCGGRKGLSTAAGPDLADEPPQAPTKSSRKRRNVSTDDADPSLPHPVGDTLALTAEVLRAQRISALECRVEWQHKRIYDLTCQVQGLEAAIAGAAEAATLGAAKRDGADVMTAGALPR